MQSAVGSWKILNQLDQDAFIRVVTKAIEGIINNEYAAGAAKEENVCEVLLSGFFINLFRKGQEEFILAQLENEVGDELSKEKCLKMQEILFSSNNSYVKEIQKSLICLGSLSIEELKVVDVEWRLDYLLRSSSSGKLSVPMYYIRFKLLDQRNNVEYVNMRCSYEQLQDIVLKLKDALLESERYLSQRS